MRADRIAALRELAARYRAYAELHERLVQLGGLVGAAERAQAEAEKAKAAEKTARERARAEELKYQEALRKNHNAHAVMHGRRGVRLA
jgi:hypothetical protein